MAYILFQVTNYAYCKFHPNSRYGDTCTILFFFFSRLALFKTSLQQLFRDERANSLPLDRVTSYLNEQYSHAPFESGEINAALERMTRDNHVMMADDIVFLI